MIKDFFLANFVIALVMGHIFGLIEGYLLKAALNRDKRLNDVIDLMKEGLETARRVQKEREGSCQQ